MCHMERIVYVCAVGYRWNEVHKTVGQKMGHKRQQPHRYDARLQPPHNPQLPMQPSVPSTQTFIAPVHL
jgi:hypothetical protein